jgi:hypothetical protein
VRTQLWWYVARSSGLMAWALSGFTILWGLTLATKALARKPPAAWLLSLHRYLAGLTVAFVGLHLLGLLLDTYVHFGLAEILVPMVSSYKPGPVAWGIAGLYLLAAIEITSLVRHRLPRRLWHQIHLLSFILFVTATVHGLSVGTDRRVQGVVLAGAVIAGAVGAMTGIRFGGGDAGRPRRSGATVGRADAAPLFGRPSGPRRRAPGSRAA